MSQDYLFTESGHVVIELVDTNIDDICNDVLIHHLLPLLSFADALSFSWTCKRNLSLMRMYCGKNVIPMLPQMRLYDYQGRAVEWMIKKESKVRKGICGGILGMNMGLGKTITSIYASLLSYTPLQKPTLVLTNRSIVIEWKGCFEKFFGNAIKFIILHKDYMSEKFDRLKRKDLQGVHFVITTYDVLTATARRDEEYVENGLIRDGAKRIIKHEIPSMPVKVKYARGQDLLYSIKWERIIADESSRFVNSHTATFRAVMGLCANKRWCLTGTPIKNKDSDMFSLLMFLGFDRCEKASKWNFEMYLQKKLYKNILYMSYEDVGVVLPTKKVKEVKVELSSNEKKCYEYFLNRAKNTYNGMMVGNIQFIHVLALFTILREICIAPYLICKESKRGKSNYSDLDKYISSKLDANNEFNLASWVHDVKGKAGTKSAKMKALKIIIKKAKDGDKFVIFSSFTSALDLAERSLKKLKIGIARIDGDVVGRERDEVLQKFKDDPKVKILMMTYRTGSEGLNLACANKVIYLDLWWCPSVEKQSAGRVWRIGQSKKVYIYKLVSNDTIETRMITMIQNTKNAIEEQYKKGSKNIDRILDKQALGMLLGL